MRTFLTLALAPVFAVVLTLVVPTAASAVTISEIVSLSKAGVSEQVILALIDRDQTIFSLPAEQIIALQKDGVSDTLLLAMLRSGRDQPESGSQAQPQFEQAQPQFEPPLVQQDAGPDIFVAGDAPEQPGVAADSGRVLVSPYAVPIFVPVPYPVAAVVPRSRCEIRPAPKNDGSAPTGIFFLHPTHGIFFPNPPAEVVGGCVASAPRSAPAK